MDGKGRATDNAFIERWFRTLKHRHIYLNPAKDGWELYEGIEGFVHKYNRRRHQGINRQKPIDLYSNTQQTQTSKLAQVVWSMGSITIANGGKYLVKVARLKTACRRSWNS